MPKSGIVTSISLWFGNTGFEARTAIYTHPTGQLLVQSQSEPITSIGWHNFTIPATFLLSGFYGLAWKNSLDAIVANDAGEATQTARTPEPYGNFSSTFGEPEFFAKEVSIYATYNPVATKIGVLRYPETPSYDENVTVIADVKDGESQVGLVILSYSMKGMNWINMTMLLKEGSFTAIIPSQPYNTTVYYKVYVYDIYSNFIGDSDVNFYTVKDSYPPVISSLTQEPWSPCYNNTVTISAKITEPKNASGIKLAILNYWNGSKWINITMTLQEELYKAAIPALPYGTRVNYTIFAFDYAGNAASMEIYSYFVDDKYLPIARIDTPLHGSYVSNEITITIFANDTNIDKAELSINGTTVQSWYASGQYAYVWNSTIMFDGNCFLKLTVTDKAGNTAEKQIEIIIDNTKPMAIIDTPNIGSYVKEIVPISFKGDDINFLKMELYIADSLIETWEWQGLQTTYWKTTEYPDGNYLIKLKVYDKAMNKAEEEIYVTVDNTQPITTMTFSTLSKYVKGTITINLKGEDANLAQINLKIDELTKQTWNFSGNQTYQWNTAEYTDGNHIIILTVQDKAGNLAEIRHEKIVDNTPPIIELTSWEPTEPLINENVNVQTKVTDSPSNEMIENVTLWYKATTSTEWQFIKMTFKEGKMERNDTRTN